jgi:hypothetical protein
MSKSTSISDLPKTNNSEDANSQEAMMVNSILQEIEQEDESLNDENVDSLNYVMDTSQIPPKIENKMPTPEMIQSVTNEIFQASDEMPPVETIAKVDKKQEEEIKKVLEEKPEPKMNKLGPLKDIDGFMTNIKKKIIGPVVIMILFLILTHTKVNNLIIKILPKLGNVNGNTNNLGNFMKSLLLGLVYFILSWFI